MSGDVPAEPKAFEVPRRAPLEGTELFVGMKGETVLDFWRFAMSDLRTNNTRGYLAEFLVARALGVAAYRVEWDDFDVLWGDVKIEVKSSAYLQVWSQRALSRIQFTNLRGRTPLVVDDGPVLEPAYKADVYVFSVQTAKDHEHYDPLNVEAWRFYVAPRSLLAELGARTLSLGTVSSRTPAVGYSELRHAITEVVAGASSATKG